MGGNKNKFKNENKNRTYGLDYAVKVFSHYRNIKLFFLHTFSYGKNIVQIKSFYLVPINQDGKPAEGRN